MRPLPRAQGISGGLENPGISDAFRRQLLERARIAAGVTTEESTGGIVAVLRRLAAGASVPGVLAGSTSAAGANIGPKGDMTSAGKGFSAWSSSDHVRTSTTFQPQIFSDATQLYDRILMASQQGEQQQRLLELQTQGNEIQANVAASVKDAVSALNSLNSKFEKPL